jgi:hypothetical protein
MLILMLSLLVLLSFTASALPASSGAVDVQLYDVQEEYSVDCGGDYYGNASYYYGYYGYYYSYDYGYWNCDEDSCDYVVNGTAITSFEFNSTSWPGYYYDGYYADYTYWYDNYYWNGCYWAPTNRTASEIYANEISATRDGSDEPSSDSQLMRPILSSDSSASMTPQSQSESDNSLAYVLGALSVLVITATVALVVKNKLGQQVDK